MGARVEALGYGPCMGLLDGKRILITGVLTDASLAFGVARLAQEQGAELVLSGAGRGLSLTKRTARKLPTEADVIEIDVTDQAHLADAAADLTQRWGRLDGLLHAIGFAPEECLGGDIFRAEWERRGGGPADLGVLAEGARRCHAASARRGGLVFGDGLGLRCQGGLAGL